VEEFNETDTSLIQIPKETEPAFGDIPEEKGPQADAWGLIDEDGDGIILQDVKGEGYSGYMMVVLDPSRVIVGSDPNAYGGWGYTVEEMVGKFDAVAGTNAGGFLDPDGQGDGSVPDTMVVYDGRIYCASNGTRRGFVGLDSNHILHVSTRITEAEIKEKDIRYGVCFGPVLISNGEPCDVESGGVNPRTAIGQRSDGAILMLVIDGRQVISMGATMHDLIDIMLDYGAVNACNLDGGSSTLMWYEGGYVNNCASVIGIRPVPTAILVLKEGESGNG
jgi:exopolysaccharide biosynthesis protein